MKKTISILIIIFVGALLYANSLTIPFIYDDIHTIVENPRIKQPKYLFSLFDLSLTPLTQGRAVYRPVLLFTFFLNYIASGLNPWSYHLFNIILHILNAILVFTIIYFILSSYLGAQDPYSAYIISLFSSLLFLVHPVNSETVNYISCRSELLAGFFLLFSFLLCLEAIKQKNSSFYRAAVLAFVLGVLSKEIAVVLPALLITYDFCFLKDPSGFRLRFKKYYLAYFVILLTYIILRTFILGNFFGSLYELPIAVTFGSNLLTQIKVITFLYLRLLFIPFGLSIDHYVPVSRSLLEPRVISSLAVIVILLWAAFKNIKKRPAIAFFIFWFFIQLVPTTVIPLHILANEHRLYLCSVSFGFLLSLTLTQAHSFKKKLKLIPLFSLCLIFLFLLTLRRNFLWKDPLKFWQSQAITSSSSRTHYHLGLEYLKRGNFLEAEARFQRALSIKPDYYYAYAGLGYLYHKKGEKEKAIEYYRQSQQINPLLAITFYLVGNIFEEQKRSEEAIREYRHALRLAPDLAFAHFRLGVLLDQKGEYRQAEQEYGLALQSNPAIAEAHYNLGIIYGKKGNGRAITEFKKAIELKPEYAEAHYNLAISYLGLTPPNLAFAKRHFEIAIKLGYNTDWDLIHTLINPQG